MDSLVLMVIIYITSLICQVECDNSLSMKKEEERNDNDEVHVTTVTLESGAETTESPESGAQTTEGPKAGEQTPVSIGPTTKTDSGNEKCKRKVYKRPFQNLVCRKRTDWIMVFQVNYLTHHTKQNNITHSIRVDDVKPIIESTEYNKYVYTGRIIDIWKPQIPEWIKEKLFQEKQLQDITTYNMELRPKQIYILSGSRNKTTDELFINRCTSLKIKYDPNVGSIYTPNLKYNYLNNCDCKVKYRSFVPCEDTVDKFVDEYRDNNTCLGRREYHSCENSVGYCRRVDGVCRWNTFVGDFFVREDLHGCRTAACGGPLPGPSYCHAQLQHSC